MRYSKDSWSATENQLFRDAKEITAGASNPVAVTGVLQDMLTALRRHGQPLDHPAALVTLSHLSFLLCHENVAEDAWRKFYAIELAQA